MQFVRILLLPISWLYGLVLLARNLLYNFGWLPTFEVPFKSIVVGNLQLGGTGKTPHLVYLLDSLSDKKCAVVSRGYGGSNNQTIVVDPSMLASLVGDEPLEIARKFPNVRVIVDRNRQRAVEYISSNLPDTELILFDDALQHRKIKAGLYLLLTTWAKPYTRDFYLPSGSLRDHKIRSSDTSIRIVTKSPMDTSRKQREEFQLNNNLRAPVIFTRIRYGELYPLFKKELAYAGQAVILISGIAKPDYFETAAEKKYKVLKHFKYSDHHPFSAADLDEIENYRLRTDKKAVWLTTEKDASRLVDTDWFKAHSETPIYIWPISVQESDEGQPLIAAIDKYVNE